MNAPFPGTLYTAADVLAYYPYPGCYIIVLCTAAPALIAAPRAAALRWLRAHGIPCMPPRLAARIAAKLLQLQA